MENDLKPAASAANKPINLGDVIAQLEQSRALSQTRQRDLRSAVVRVASLLGDAPDRITLDLRAIETKLKMVNLASEQISAKSFSNIRANFVAAVRVTGLRGISRRRKGSLTPAWLAVFSKAPNKHSRIGLSRFVHYANGQGVDPGDVDSQLMERFMHEIREGSLHRSPNNLHRATTRIWNALAATQPELGLKPVGVPSFRKTTTRIQWDDLPEAFRKDTADYLTWCESADAFAVNARPRPLAKNTLKLRRNQIHAAVSALAGSSIQISALRSLADLVTPEAFKTIMRKRLGLNKEHPKAFDRDLAKMLVQIAREWLKGENLDELKRLAARVRPPTTGLTAKNKKILRQFDDPKNLLRLDQLPRRLWEEVKRDEEQDFRTLAKAQAAIAIAILTFMPIRMKNLIALTYDLHLFLQDDVRATSTMELSAREVKNDTDLAFDVPTDVANMLRKYRNEFVPKVIGKRPDLVFVNVDGTPKDQATVAGLIQRYIKKYIGVVMTPHVFRHLSAKRLLESEPGAFEIVKQLLGHKNLKTTVNSYAGIDSRRAGRHHQRLIEEALAQKSAKSSSWRAGKEHPK